MNRPKIADYRLNGNAFEISGQYVFDLEKYCDWLEFLLKGEGINPNPCEGCSDYCYLADECKSNGGCGYEHRIKKLQKALDKACQQLADNEECITFDNTFHSAEVWKKEFLEDE